jgi:hypothetical protein
LIPQSTLGRKTGFGFYTGELIKNLKKVDASNQLYFYSSDKNHNLSVPQRFIWDQITFPKLASAHRPDVIHQPCYSARFFITNQK